jgi:lysophospholipase L1-like esterase
MFQHQRKQSFSLLLTVLMVLALSAGATDLILEKGDTVAIVGDSITEQKIYSRFMETYLLACVPELELNMVQLGWSGERAQGFAWRMEHDLFPFKPDVVTTCYGMNDGQYRPYSDDIGQAYRDPMTRIVAELNGQKATVLVGSPGCVDSVTFNPRWAQNPPTADIYNENLAKLRDIARQVAEEAGMPFANVYDPMLSAMRAGKSEHGDSYHTGGSDGIHPADNGHLVMAYAFLKGLGLDGDIARITVDMKGKATASEGHEIKSSRAGRVKLKSHRYPFCFPADKSDSDEAQFSTREALAYVPFNGTLNRFMLVVRNLDADEADVTWGDVTKRFTRANLKQGINLSAEFPDNPFSAAFSRLDAKVAEKQVFETFAFKTMISNMRNVPSNYQNNGRLNATLGHMRKDLYEQHHDLQKKVRNAVNPLVHSIRVRAR